LQLTILLGIVLSTNAFFILATCYKLVYSVFINSAAVINYFIKGPYMSSIKKDLILGDLVQKLVDYGCNVADPNTGEITLDSISEWATLTFEIDQDAYGDEHEEACFSYTELWAIQTFAGRIAPMLNRRVVAGKAIINGRRVVVKNGVVFLSNASIGTTELTLAPDNRPVIKVALRDPILGGRAFFVELTDVGEHFAGLIDAIDKGFPELFM